MNRGAFAILSIWVVTAAFILLFVACFFVSHTQESERICGRGSWLDYTFDKDGETFAMCEYFDKKKRKTIVKIEDEK